MKCFDCPHTGGSRKMCCIGGGGTMAMSVALVRVLDANPDHVLRAEPIQPERKITGNRKQRRAAERRAK